jgi:hypothetical protein
MEKSPRATRHWQYMQDSAFVLTVQGLAAIKRGGLSPED